MQWFVIISIVISNVMYSKNNVKLSSKFVCRNSPKYEMAFTIQTINVDWLQPLSATQYRRSTKCTSNGYLTICLWYKVQVPFQLILLLLLLQLFSMYIVFILCQLYVVFFVFSVDEISVLSLLSQQLYFGPNVNSKKEPELRINKSYIKSGTPNNNTWITSFTKSVHLDIWPFM